MFTWSSFKDLSTIQLIQNLWCYMDIKRERNSWYEFDIFDEYIGYNFWFLCINWPKFFPDMFVYKKVEEIDKHFDPRAPANEGNVYNKLLHYGKK